MEKWLSQTLCGTGARTKLTCDRFPIKYQPSEIAWMSGLFNDEKRHVSSEGQNGPCLWGNPMRPLCSDRAGLATAPSLRWARAGFVVPRKGLSLSLPQFPHP